MTHSNINKLLAMPKAEDRSQLGAWLNLASPLVAEALAATGFDWLLIDAEHGPNTVDTVLAQLQAIAPYSTVPVVRIPNHDTALIKRYLDIGAHNLLVPMVDTVQQAREIIAATRYPPQGVRGVGAGLGRASRWSNQADYLKNANAGIRLVMQIESKLALQNLESIVALDEVDAVFFGPADIAASMGHLGNPSNTEVKEAVLGAIANMSSRGITSGVFSADQEFLKLCEAAGARLLGVTADVSLLVSGGKSRLSQFREN